MILTVVFWFISDGNHVFGYAEEVDVGGWCY